MLRNPRRDTGAVGLRKSKLEPTNLGPYEVIRQERSVHGRSNTVRVREVNDRAREHEFHAATLRIFIGGMELAKELEKMDHMMYTIIRVISVLGNTARRDQMQVQVELEDGSIEEIPYETAVHTAAFTAYCERITIGKVLAMTRAELQQYIQEQSPAPNQSIVQLMTTWPTEKRIEVQDRRYITAHYWHSQTWHIYQDAGTLPPQCRNYEPMLLAIVVKITRKAVDLEIPALAKSSSGRTKPFVIAMTLPKLLLYTTTEQHLTERAIVLTHDLLAQCTLKAELHAAARFN